MKLDSAVIEALVLPWVQALSDLTPTDPALTLTNWVLTPTDDTWQAGAWVTVSPIGGVFAVAAHFDDTSFTATIRPAGR